MILIVEKLTPRKIQSLKTKKKILDESLKLFSEKGFDNVTIDEIVQKTNTSKGAFYGHFESKDQIFIEKYKEIDKHYTKFIESLPNDISYKKKILRFVQMQMSYIENLGKDLMRVIYINNISTNSSHSLMNKDRSFYKILELMVKEGMELGEFVSAYDSHEISKLIARGIRGAVYDWCAYENDFELVKEGNKLVLFILYGMKN